MTNVEMLKALKEGAGIPYFYPLTFTLPEGEGARQEQTVQTTGEGFVALWLTWDQGRSSADKIIKVYSDDPPVTLAYQFVLPSDKEPVRDGQFLVELRAGGVSASYQKDPVLIRNLAGEPSTGRPVPFPMPICIGPRDTLTVGITNLLDRTGQTPAQRRVDLCFCGIQAVKIIGQ